MKYYKVILHLLFVVTSTQLSAQPKLVAALGYGGTKAGGSIVRTDLPGTTPGVLHAFDRLTPNWPYGGVCAGDGNWLYGTTVLGGTNNSGALYRIQRDGTSFTKLFDLAALNGLSRCMPYYHTDGIVYYSEESTIRKYNTTNGSHTAVTSNAFIQSRNLHIDDDDWMYFAEQTFPTRLVKMKTDGTLWTELHFFNAATEGDDGTPGVTEIPGDSLIGLQIIGGTNNGGTIYSIKKDGTGFTVLHQFTTATGTYPLSKLVYFDGKLFGTTAYGGDFNKGVLFSINSDGTNYRVLHHLALGDGFWTESVYGNISISSNGRIFGAFSDMLHSGSQYFRLFKADTSGADFTPMFTGTSFNLARDNGQYGQDVLLLNNEEIFFTSSQMGRHDGGVLNHSDTSGNGADRYHYGMSPDGFRPLGGVIKASDGKLYGTASIGGPQGSGVIYSMNDNGTGFTRLKQLTDAEGYEVNGKLLEASDGRLYGACRFGGPNFLGTIFRINKNGTGFQVIFDFPATAGYAPVGGLIEDPGGTLYGVNIYSSGSIFKINKDGSGYTELKVFAQGTGDLYYPYNGVVRGGNYLYGTCGYGGAANAGGVFRIKTDGTGFQVLHEFNGTTEGDLPVGTLLLASDGKLYGATVNGGSDSYGYIFRIDTTGTNFTILRDLSDSDGGNIWAGLIQGSDGLIYGGTTFSSSATGGTLFRMNPDGTNFTVLKSFDQFTEGQSVQSVIDLNGSVVLPVTLLSFEARKRNQTTLLTWKTAQEINSDRFEIQRSADGIRYSVIGVVAASGNSNATVNYTFTDNNPLRGVNYYRLNQIDADGSFSYSRIVTANFGGSEELAVFPNPVADQLYIRMPGNNQFRSIRIVDAAGKIVLQQALTGSAVSTINVSSLPKGWYMAQLIGEGIEQKVFVKE
jgi:uncharacterized repeat protein (TIGR03803 family)